MLSLVKGGNIGVSFMSHTYKSIKRVKVGQWIVYDWGDGDVIAGRVKRIGNGDGIYDFYSIGFRYRAITEQIEKRSHMLTGWVLDWEFPETRVMVCDDEEEMVAVFLGRML